MRKYFMQLVTLVVFCVAAIVCCMDNNIAGAGDGFVDLFEKKLSAQGYVEEPVVIVHSFSGRTATVGESIASLFGGRMFRYSDGIGKFPNGHGGVDQDEISSYLNQNTAKTLYLGFPIWNEDVSEPAKEFIATLDLNGKTVVPFYTYLHSVNQNDLDAYMKHLEDRGAIVKPALAFRFSFSCKKNFIRKATRTEILKRQDLWEETENINVSCKPDSSAKGMTLCEVPEGDVWVYHPDSKGDGLAEPVLVRKSVAAFAINKTEVTLKQYSRCVEDGACPEIEMDGSFCGNLIDDNELLSVPCVSSVEAEAFCNWAGLRLPNIDEWTRAARGQSTNNYTWGDSFPADGTTLNMGESPGTGFKEYSLAKADENFKSDGFPGLAPSCSFSKGNSPFGLCDMHGNLAELVSIEEAENNHYALVGGSWMDVDPDTFSMNGSFGVGENFGFYLSGFRCVK